MAAEAEGDSPGEGKEGGLAQGTQQEAEYEEDERDLYCVCQQPYNVDTAMISCDACEEWFHCRCIGLTQSAARTIKKYLCPLCAALRGNDRELEAALARTRRTRYALFLPLHPLFCTIVRAGSAGNAATMIVQ